MISIAIIGLIGFLLINRSLSKREKQEMKRLQKKLYSL
jgi:hypothetical protein